MPKRSTWLIGCAAGCGALLLVVGLLLGGFAWFLHKTVRGFEAAAESGKLLDERHGDEPSFTPWTDGAIPAPRLEAFLAVRDACAPARERIAESFSSMQITGEQVDRMKEQSFLQQLRAVLRIGRDAAGLGREIGEFFEARNQALLDAGMGMGEYTYLYVLAYRSWLGHGRDDGPAPVRVSVDADERTEIEVDHGMGEVADGSRVRRNLLAMLRNQQDALPESASDAWRRQLAEEIEALREDPAREPWQDGLPERIAHSLEPYRERLEASYDPGANLFELLRNRQERGFVIRAD